MKLVIEGVIDLGSPFTQMRQISKQHSYFFALEGQFGLFFHDINDYKRLLTSGFGLNFTQNLFNFNLIQAKDENEFIIKTTPII